MSISYVSKIMLFLVKIHYSLCFTQNENFHTQSVTLSLSPLAGAQEDVATEHKAEASADWSEQEGHL